MTARRRILIVEDDEAARELFIHFLDKENCEVFTAEDGIEALKLAAEKRPDLVILDLMLPELHGIGVCKRLRADPVTRGVKVLIISVKGFPADRNQSFEAGADHFLAKPVSRDDFLSAVHQLLK